MAIDSTQEPEANHPPPAGISSSSGGIPGVSASLVVATDCRLYVGSQPCAFHKLDGRTCDACADLARVASRVLIVKLAALGDVLRTTVLLPAVRARYPNVHITWVTTVRSRPLLAKNPLIDRVLCVEEDYLASLLTERFDVGFGLDSDEQGARVLAVARCDRKLGFSVNDAGQVVPASSSARRVWEMGLNDQLKRANRLGHARLLLEMCELAGATVERPQYHLDDAARGVAAARLANAGPRRPWVLINAGGGIRWEQKRWTEDGIVQLVNVLNDKRPDVGILLLCGPAEGDRRARLLARCGGQVLDAGADLTVEQAAALVAAVDVVVTSDSLVLHLANAFHVTAVALVGPTSPWELTDYETVAILTGDVDCIGCYLAHCPLPVTCMQRLEATAVFERVQALLP